MRDFLEEIISKRSARNPNFPALAGDPPDVREHLALTCRVEAERRLVDAAR